MASIYKLTRDKKKKNATYWVSFQDHEGNRRTKKGFTDKQLTQQLAARLEDEVRLRKTGMIDADLESNAKRNQVSIKEHLQEFEQSLIRRNNTEKHVRLMVGRIQRIVEGCEFKKVVDLSAEVVECYLTDLRETADLGHRTINHYAAAFEQFTSWLTRTDRIAVNPVKKLPRLNNETDIRHKRRALTSEEFSKLIEATFSSEDLVQCYDGETRARIYLLSYLTGLRKSELGSLTPSSFNFVTNPPIVTIAATISKHRKEDVLPLHPDLVPMLQDWIVDLQSDEVLFPKLAKRRASIMVQKDLARAGIPYKTSAGIADFHAVGRHSYVTELLRNGATLPEAKELARHSDIKMTMQYTHIGLEDQAKALASLPSKCLRIVCTRGCTESQTVSQVGNEKQDKEPANPIKTTPHVASKQKKALSVTENAKRRARDSNPQPLTGHHNSNVAASQFAYPPGLVIRQLTLQLGYHIRLFFSSPLADHLLGYLRCDTFA